MCSHQLRSTQYITQYPEHIYIIKFKVRIKGRQRYDIFYSIFRLKKAQLGWKLNEIAIKRNSMFIRRILEVFLVENDSSNVLFDLQHLSFKDWHYTSQSFEINSADGTWWHYPDGQLCWTPFILKFDNFAKCF